MQPTWTPHEKHGQLTAKSDLPDTVFAFPKQRKEPLPKPSTFVTRSRDSSGDRRFRRRSRLGLRQHREGGEILRRRSFRDVMARARRSPATQPQRGCRQGRCDQARARRTVRRLAPEAVRRAHARKATGPGWRTRIIRRRLRSRSLRLSMLAVSRSLAYASRGFKPAYRWGVAPLRPRQ